VDKKGLFMGTLFGTDGIRGLANEYPMTVEMAVRVGRVVATVFRNHSGSPKIIVGRDTRLSGHMLESAIVAGICSAGSDAYLTGVLPTPGVALAASATKAGAGIVISASHNPFYDNGIKLFKGNGYKLSDEKEAEIEKLVLDDTIAERSQTLRETGTVIIQNDASENYIAFLKSTLPEDLSLNGLGIVLDCANGATFRTAPQLFSDLGAKVAAIGVDPDGKNINHHCGSEHTAGLIQMVLETRADIGLALDGDGDRLIAVDEKGQILSGDHILLICANLMKRQGRLKNQCVVSTVMSNMGLSVALKKMGIRHEKSKVGDRYVMEKMNACGAVIGGEDSGHMIFADHHTTGDGSLTGLKLIEAIRAENKPLSELSRMMSPYPQVLINVDVHSKPDIESVPAIVDAVKSVESELGDRGRVLVRYSGTQPICRIMVEGPSESDTQRYCKQISDIIIKIIGI
jgi:phosphoglucosamine mutase